MAEKKLKHEILAEMFIEQMKKGTAPWQRPWEGGSDYPFNPTTGNDYHGLNTLSLMATAYEKNYADPRWMTYKQAQSVGAQVKSGEKSTPIFFWQTTEMVEKLDDNGKPIIGADGKPEKEVKKLERPRAIWSSVFNAEQIDNLLPFERPHNTWEPIPRAQELLEASGAVIENKFSGRAFYSIMTDSITLPLQDQFPDPVKYYQVALHELSHWTGHESRLNRDLGHPFGSPEYAKEELIAEISSVLLGSSTGLGFEPREDNVAYVKNWIKILEDDPKFIMNAASSAEKISRFLNEKVDLQIDQEIAQTYQEQSVEPQTTVQTQPNTEKLEYIKVPYKERHEVKAAGARWDSEGKSWYIPKGISQEPFKKWMDAMEGEKSAKISSIKQTSPEDLTPQEKAAAEQIKKPEPDTIGKKEYLAVPYIERNQAKAAGARWDKEAKAWYVGKNADLAKLEQWRIKDTANIMPTAPTPAEEFLSFIQDHGYIGSESPIMDGIGRRVKVAGDEGTQNKSGFYKAYSDGVPAGAFINHRTGINERWHVKGYVLDEKAKAELMAKSAEEKEKKRIEKDANEKLAADRTTKNLSAWQKVEEQTSYHSKKNIPVMPGTFLTEKEKDLCLPTMDASGKIWGCQFIQEDGTKRFSKESKRVGCFHPVGGDLKAIEKSPVIIIAEGYATAVTMQALTGTPSVAALTAKNLEPVAVALHKRFPDKQIVIAGDNDQHLVDHPKVKRNVGKEGAEAAAKAVGGTVIMPRFKAGSPTGADATDFNDLVNREGAVAAKAQVLSVMNKVQAALNKEPAKHHQTQQRKVQIV